MEETRGGRQERGLSGVGWTITAAALAIAAVLVGSAISAGPAGEVRYADGIPLVWNGQTV
jgi:hypothetical protein